MTKAQSRKSEEKHQEILKFSIVIESNPQSNNKITVWLVNHE